MHPLLLLLPLWRYFRLRRCILFCFCLRFEDAFGYIDVSFFASVAALEMPSAAQMHPLLLLLAFGDALELHRCILFCFCRHFEDTFGCPDASSFASFGALKMLLAAQMHPLLLLSPLWRCFGAAQMHLLLLLSPLWRYFRLPRYIFVCFFWRFEDTFGCAEASSSASASALKMLPLYKLQLHCWKSPYCRYFIRRFHQKSVLQSISFMPRQPANILMNHICLRYGQKNTGHFEARRFVLHI